MLCKTTLLKDQFSCLEVKVKKRGTCTFGTIKFRSMKEFAISHGIGNFILNFVIKKFIGNF